jgi:hypothetical protein
VQIVDFPFFFAGYRLSYLPLPFSPLSLVFCKIYLQKQGQQKKKEER